MTEIDVPDWVVKAAEDARVHCLNAVTAYGSAGVDERYHMAMKASLTAALGAWVVESAYCDPSDPWNATAFSWPGSARRFNHETPLYTLRQEKPE